jgi:hypothetical protein
VEAKVSSFEGFACPDEAWSFFDPLIIIFSWLMRWQQVSKAVELPQSLTNSLHAIILVIAWMVIEWAVMPI